ncbi:MAG: AAA family ATPase, partial [Actinomycetota bacterium]
MKGQQKGLFGRGTELAGIDRLLDLAVDGPAGVLLAGEAGIGKTSLWLEGIAAAQRRGFRLMRSAPAEPERHLAYSSLSDLLGDIHLSTLADLPAAQRTALEVALLQAAPGPSPVEQSAVAAGVLSILRSACAEQPVLVAIDDVQWLDDASAAAVAFALRRAPIGRLRFLATHRTGEFDPLGLDRPMAEESMDRIEVGPVPLDDFDALLAREFSPDLRLPETAAIHRACSGNPFLGLELGHAFAGGRLKLEPGRTVRLPRRLDRLVSDRLNALPPEVARLLMAISALSHPSIDDLEALDDCAQANLAVAEWAGVVAVDAGRIRFTHPLLGAAAYSRSSERQRRSLHARLAEVVVDPEEAARHMALGTPPPSERVATALEVAAGRALARG